MIEEPTSGQWRKLYWVLHVIAVIAPWPFLAVTAMMIYAWGSSPNHEPSIWYMIAVLVWVVVLAGCGLLAFEAGTALVEKLREKAGIK